MFVIFLAFLLFSSTPSVSFSQDKTTSEADRNFLEAEDDFDKGKLEDAQHKYEIAIQMYDEQKDRAGVAKSSYKLGRTLGREGHFDEANELFQKALKIHQELGDENASALDLTRIALTQERVANYQESLATSEKALVLHEKNKNFEGIAITLDNEGTCYYRLAEPEKAIAAFERALPAAKQTSDKGIVAQVLMNMGQVYWGQGDYARTLEIYDEAQSFSEQVDDPELVAQVIANKAIVYTEQGDFARALDAYDKSLKIFQQVGDQDQIAGHYLNLGSLEYQLGNYTKSLDLLNQSYELAKELKDTGLEADALGFMGRVHQDLGDYDVARDYLEQSMKLTQEIGEKQSTVYNFIALGDLQNLQKQAQLSMNSYRKALSLSEEIGRKKSIADSLQKIAGNYAKLGDHQKELELQQQALAIRESLDSKPGIGESNMFIGTAQYSLGDLKDADVSLTKAIDTLRELGVLEPLWPALYEKGLVSKANGNVEDSIHWLKESVDVIEQMRGTVELVEQKSGFFENKRDVYEDLVLMLASTNDNESAFDYAERSKARAFLDLLSEGHIDPQAGLNQAQYEAKRQVLTQLVNLRSKVRDEYEKDQPDAASLRRWKDRQNKLEADYLDLTVDIRKKNPRYAELQDPQPIRLPEVRALIDSNTAIAEYFVGKSKSLLLVITSDQFKVYSLPGEQLLNEQILGLLEAIQKPDPVWEASHGSYTKYKSLAFTLYGEVLKPAEQLLKGKRKIVIAPDGPLYYLPFECLLVRAATPNSDFSQLPYLTLQYQTQYVPSVSALEALLSKTAKPSGAQQKQFVVFADPGPEKNSDGTAGNSRSVDASSGQNTMALLPYALEEAKDISRLFPKQQAMVFLGKDASESNVKNSDLQKYRMIHFASHGLVDEDRPQFSALVLSPGDGKLEDGMLTMREIFDLQLDSDLVVLSACNTALGKEVRGEGISSLARAFFSAGTSNVVASTWSVLDSSTAIFMTNFYSTLLKNGSDKAAALQAARVKMIREKHFSHPFYWAPFILMGSN